MSEEEVIETDFISDLEDILGELNILSENYYRESILYNDLHKYWESKGITQ